MILGARYKARCTFDTSNPDATRGEFCSQIIPSQLFFGRQSSKRSSKFATEALQQHKEEQTRHLRASEACSRRAALLGASASLFTLQASGVQNANAAPDVYATYQKAAVSYDGLDDGFLAFALGLEKLRRELLQSAKGDVLEVAVGTGINLPLYEVSKLRTFKGLDLSPEMLSQAQTKLSRLPMAEHASLVQGNVEALPFADSSFDTAVSTFSLCVFKNPLQALQEIHRVLRPDGQALLLEHSRSNFPPLAWYQDLTASTVAEMSKGCVWNQDVIKLTNKAGLRVVGSKMHDAGLLTVVRAIK